MCKKCNRRELYQIEIDNSKSLCKLRKMSKTNNITVSEELVNNFKKEFFNMFGTEVKPFNDDRVENIKNNIMKYFLGQSAEISTTFKDHPMLETFEKINTDYMNEILDIIDKEN